MTKPITRWICDDGRASCYYEPHEDPNGEWVKYEDIRHLLAEPPDCPKCGISHYPNCEQQSSAEPKAEPVVCAHTLSRIHEWAEAQWMIAGRCPICTAESRAPRHDPAVRDAADSIKELIDSQHELPKDAKDVLYGNLDRLYLR